MRRRGSVRPATGIVVAAAMLVWAGNAEAQSPPAAPCPDSSMQVGYSGYVLNRTTNTFDTLARMTNASGDPIQAPVWWVLLSVTPAAITLANTSGQTPDGKPFVAVPVPAGGLAAGRAIEQVLLKFRNDQRVRFTFTAEIRTPRLCGATVDADDAARQAVWAAFKAAIRRGDDAAAKAQFSQDPDPQAFVAEFLSNLTPADRANIDAILPPIYFWESYGNPAVALFAQYLADKVTAGVLEAHAVTFIREPDGVWRIHGF